jgi:dienelactone hydrolase
MNVKSRLIYIPVGREEIQGDLNIPDRSKAIVVFVQGSGRGRHDARSKYVAGILNDARIATLHTDLLTSEEARLDIEEAHPHSKVHRLADRLIMVTKWMRGQGITKRLRIGYFGASTGATAALVAAAKEPDFVEAIVSSGGRPDLAGPWLMRVHAPTLLIVGENDKIVIQLNYQAGAELKTEHHVRIVPNAGHLFEEPGALEKVALLARDWFEEHLILASRHAA